MKKTISVFLAFLMLLSINCTAFASEENDLSEHASYYLDSYAVVLTAKGNGKMAITANVEGVGVQDQIGLLSIDIDQKVDGKWCYYDTLDAVDHPEFYDYDSWDYFHTIYFYGTPGVSYRVTLTVYAEKGGGWDTGYVSSFAATCT